MRVLKKDLIEKVAQLESDLMELVLNPNSVKSLGIKINYQFKHDAEKFLWQGDVNKKQNFDGFVSRIKTIKLPLEK